MRLRLRKADRLSEDAMARGLLFVKTPGSRSSASLRLMTPADHFPLFRGFLLTLWDTLSSAALRASRQAALLTCPPCFENTSSMA